MLKVILIFNVYLAYFFPITTGRKLPNEINGWLHHHTVDASYLPQRDDSSASEEVHVKRVTKENMSRSTSVAYYGHKLFRLTHRFANPNFPLQALKIEPENKLSNEAKDDFWKKRVKREEECFLNQFKCATGRCIPADWRCDDLEDCADKSDEHGCSTSPATAYKETTTEEPKELHFTTVLWGIIMGCVAFVILVAFLVLWCCICRRKVATSRRWNYSEADGYRMNGPIESLRTASPAYVDARQYFQLLM